MRPKAPVIAFALVLLIGLLSCGDNSQVSVEGDPVSINILAASSLTEAFTDIEQVFESMNPGYSLNFVFGSSSDLAMQINEGAPSDVFVSADIANMDKVVIAGESSGSPTTFTRNTFAIIVEKGNPLNISSVDDLAQSNIVLAVCVETAPCGRGAKQIFANAGVAYRPKSYEAQVKGVVTKVLSGEADAGIVYVTDALANATRANNIEIPSEINVITDYLAVVTKASSHREPAEMFIKFLLSNKAQAILHERGFITQ